MPQIEFDYPFPISPATPAIEDAIDFLEQEVTSEGVSDLVALYYRLPIAINTDKDGPEGEFAGYDASDDEFEGYEDDANEATEHLDRTEDLADAIETFLFGESDPTLPLGPQFLELKSVPPWQEGIVLEFFEGLEGRATSLGDKAIRHVSGAVSNLEQKDRAICRGAIARESRYAVWSQVKEEVESGGY